MGTDAEKLLRQRFNHVRGHVIWKKKIRAWPQKKENKHWFPVVFVPIMLCSSYWVHRFSSTLNYLNLDLRRNSWDQSQIDRDVTNKVTWLHLTLHLNLPPQANCYRAGDVQNSAPPISRGRGGRRGERQKTNIIKQRNMRLPVDCNDLWVGEREWEMTWCRCLQPKKDYTTFIFCTTSPKPARSQWI